MDGIKRKVFEIIREMIEEKQATRSFPPWPTLLDIRHRIGEDCVETLRELVRDDVLTYHITVNKVAMFELTHPQQQSHDNKST